MHDVADFNDLNVQAFVLLFDRVAERCVEIPNSDSTSVVTEVCKNLSVDFEVDLLGQNPSRVISSRMTSSLDDSRMRS